MEKRRRIHGNSYANIILHNIKINSFCLYLPYKLKLKLSQLSKATLTGSVIITVVVTEKDSPSLHSILICYYSYQSRNCLRP